MAQIITVNNLQLPLSLVERTEDTVTRAAFAQDGGKVTSKWLLSPTSLGRAITASDLSTIISQLIGTTSVAVGDGTLTRQPPVADPVYPWLFCDKVETEGIGQWAYTPANPTLEVPPLPNFALYNSYILSLEFVPRPYLVMVNTPSPGAASTTWYNFAGNEQTFGYCGEQDRFVYPTLEPTFDYVTAQQGQMVFKSSTLPANTIYAGSPRMPLGIQKLKVTWYGVPYRYVTSDNSAISYFSGCINQNGIKIYNKDYLPGELLYMGYNAVPYTPPVPAIVWQSALSTVPGGPQPIGGVPTTEKLCNIELHFFYVKRIATDLPFAGIFDPSGGNYVAQGHNLLPYMGDRQYHYAVSTGGAVGGVNLPAGVPSFYSFPAECLFYDPDADGALDITAVWS